MFYLWVSIPASSQHIQLNPFGPVVGSNDYILMYFTLLDHFHFRLLYTFAPWHFTGKYCTFFVDTFIWQFYLSSSIKQFEKNLPQACIGHRERRGRSHILPLVTLCSQMANKKRIHSCKLLQIVTQSPFGSNAMIFLYILGTFIVCRTEKWME